MALDGHTVAVDRKRQPIRKDAERMQKGCRKDAERMQKRCRKDGALVCVVACVV